MSRFQFHLLFLFILFSLPLFYSCNKSNKTKQEVKRENTRIEFTYDTPFYQIARKNLSDTEKADLLIAQMDAEDIVGQLFMFGYSDKIADSSILNWITDKKIGNVKIFGWNGTDFGEICESVTRMQRASINNPLGIPLFVATDQEGGWVRHIKAETSSTPGNMAIAASPYVQDSYLSSYYIAEELSYLGINMNFAPTVDIYLDKESRIIGSRAFSADPLLSANLAIAFLKGHEDFKIVSTAKHFPGHGNSNVDSHGRLPEIESDLEFLEKNDLVPYQYLIRENIPAIMSGHISFPIITQNREPATLSRILLTDLLRNKYQYDGIVITDDLNMVGMQKEGVETQDKSLEALKAGNDIVLISKKNSNPSQYQVQWENVMNEFANNDEFRRQMTKSAHRIIRTKFQYLTGEKTIPLFPSEAIAREKIPSPEAKEFFFNQSCRSITQITLEMPLLELTDNILLVSYYTNCFEAGRNRFPSARSFDASRAFRETNSSVSVANQISNMLRPNEKVVITVSDRASLNVAQNLVARGQIVYAISTLMPGYAVELDSTNAALAIYGTGRDSFDAAFAVFLGEFTPLGKLPF